MLRFGKSTNNNELVFLFSVYVVVLLEPVAPVEGEEEQGNAEQRGPGRGARGLGGGGRRVHVLAEGVGAVGGEGVLLGASARGAVLALANVAQGGGDHVVEGARAAGLESRGGRKGASGAE